MKKDYNNVMNNDATIADMVLERHVWMQKPTVERERVSHDLASRMKRVNRSDPTIYDRTYSHLMSGVMTPEDFKRKD